MTQLSEAADPSDSRLATILGRDGRTTRASGCRSSNPYPARGAPRAGSFSFRTLPLSHGFQMSQQPTFDEPDLQVVERAFERLVAAGELVVVPAMADGVARAALPEGATVFGRLARRFRSVRLQVAEITFELHGLAPLEGGIGGWRVETDSPELDIQLGTATAPDMVFDLTWSPTSGEEVVVHSTFLHFIVRAAVGDAV